MHIKKQRKKLILDLLHNKKKNIVIWGFGITGKSILNWCLNNLSKEIHYIIIDKQNYDLTIYESSYIKLVSESESETYFTLADVILPSPGIKIEKDTFFWYNKIIPELDLCSVLLDQKKIRSIIITGSIGKSSLTTIIKENIAQYKKSFLCGNIGFPILNFITKDLSGEEIFCIEASDAQLKHTVLVSPTVFLITNLFKNHLNFHKNFHHYIKAKLTPITFQISKIKKIIISDQAYNIIRHYIKTKKIEKKLIIAKTDNKKIITRKKIDYLHQKENSIFFNKKIILKDIPSVSFSSNWLMTAWVMRLFTKYRSINKNIDLPDYRLKKIFTSDKLDIFNDSKSTIIESTASGLKQLQQIYPKETRFFVLIGGLSKGVDRSKAILKLKEEHKPSITIFGKEIPLFQEKFSSISDITYEEEIKKALKNILESIQSSSKKQVILFSPGGSSFDQFSSFEDRGNYFSNIVKETLNHYT